ncbi:MAG: DNA-binding protein [Candidatus Iainarchaeum archaeon]|uniref:DNA-binding protein n=1 Tax=Candidatus Iainarchaeum sp. TaxID=3101447 RepID=A0A497JIT8_9ARCH|nr:MAG: DNA-binding protein [Candidatus Diapherotrites archaeon]
MKDVKLWIMRSEMDLRSAQVLLKEGLFADSAFHSQQAAEKALKAVYLKKFRKPFLGHSIVFMVKELKADKKIIDAAKELSLHYVAARYPDFDEDFFSIYDEDTAKRLLNLARVVVRWAKKELK